MKLKINAINAISTNNANFNCQVCRADNSDLIEIFNIPTIFNVSSTEASISSEGLRIVSSSSPLSIFQANEDHPNLSDYYLRTSDSSASGSPETGNSAGFTASPAATSVPFGVSTDLSILILGSLYGASRLRKKLASK